jgi:hypothetical protein
MFKNLKISHTVFIVIEVIVFYILARLGRRLVDSALLQLGWPDALVIAARIGFVILIVIVAFFVDRLAYKYLSGRGMLQ